MNFLKITGLIIGTGSVVGGTGAGIYYSAIKKTKFVGKLVFEKKSGSDNYLIKLLTTQQYADKEKEFDVNKSEANTKYSAINKIIDVSYELNVSAAEAKLKEIFVEDISLTDAKTKITEKATELKKLLGEEIYENLKSKFNS